MSESNTNCEKTIEDILSLYRDVERRSLTLPAVSFFPLLVVFWKAILFEVFVLLDMLLLVPMNVVILLRNLIFSGEWRYRSFIES